MDIGIRSKNFEKSKNVWKIYIPSTQAICLKFESINSIFPKIGSKTVYQPTLLSPLQKLCVMDKNFKWLQLNSIEYNKKQSK